MANEEFVAQIEGLEAAHGRPEFVAELWYNAEGDCLVYKAENVAVVAEWVDEVLTLYESADDGHTIGFKIKGVQHVFKEAGYDIVAVGMATSESGESVTVAMVLVQALLHKRATIRRREGYARAFESLGARLPVPGAYASAR